jgi:hypothetical protein
MKMTKYKMTYTQNGYMVIARIEKDGFEQVVRDFKGRFFKSEANAEKSFQKYLAKKAQQ